MICVPGFNDRASAGDVDIKILGCGAGVRLATEGQPLSRIMLRLSEELDFELVMPLRDDAILSRTMTRQPPDLVVELWPHGSAIVVEPDPDCQGMQRIVSVRLLEPGGALPDRVRTVSADRTRQENDYLRSQGVPVSE